MDHVYDDAKEIVPFELTAICPASLSSTAWAGHEAVNDVVRSRVAVGATRSATRSAWLSFPVGSHSLTLDVGAISDEERTGDFFVVYAPSWGPSRIALLPVVLPSGSGETLEVSGVPDGEGHVALIRSELVQRIEDHAAYRAAPGFMTHWPAAAGLWYGAVVHTGQTSDVIVKRYRGGAEVAAYGRISLEETLPYASTADVRLASFGPGTSNGAVAIACDGQTVVDIPFRALVELTVDGSTVNAGTGDAVTLDPACSGAGTTASVDVRVESQTHDGWLVLRSL